MTYAFTFDASACSGCKACQVACKDKNNLPAGVLWRRVYEVSGGSWTNVGARSSRPDVGNQYPVWENNVFAYNLSIACNHCVHPKCAGVCPTDAYVVREDGIVYIDETKCMGCGYCSWACPYAAPQYNPVLRQMTKCNFCYEDIYAGLPPSCVAACPLRVLDFIEIRDQRLERSTVALWQEPAKMHPFPLPDYSRTEPHLEIKPHVGMARGEEAIVSNREEVKLGNNKSEAPLVAFTLLGQMAAGMAVLSLFSGPLSISLLATLGGLIFAGGLASFLHLGRPLNAWRALTHLNKSWLSREILMYALFGLSWLVSVAFPGMGKLPLAVCGIGLVYSMAQVYRLRSVPAWDSNRTLLAFSTSTILLGGLELVVLDLLVNDTTRMGYLFFGGVGAVGALLLTLTERNRIRKTATRLRLGLIVLSLVGVVIAFLLPESVERWLVASIFILGMAEEVTGRWRFYEHLKQRVM